jgi:hypothetical protein
MAHVCPSTNNEPAFVSIRPIATNYVFSGCEHLIAFTAGHLHLLFTLTMAIMKLSIAFDDDGSLDGHGKVASASMICTHFMVSLMYNLLHCRALIHASTIPSTTAQV